MMVEARGLRAEILRAAYDSSYEEVRGLRA